MNICGVLRGSPVIDQFSAWPRSWLLRLVALLTVTLTLKAYAAGCTFDNFCPGVLKGQRESLNPKCARGTPRNRLQQGVVAEFLWLSGHFSPHAVAKEQLAFLRFRYLLQGCPAVPDRNDRGKSIGKDRRNANG